jgi:hypothetical protein
VYLIFGNRRSPEQCESYMGEGALLRSSGGPIFSLHRAVIRCGTAKRDPIPLFISTHACKGAAASNSAALSLLPLAIPYASGALRDQEPMTANGGTDPFPIPWLDKNGSHNQPAGANLEPSHIYHSLIGGTAVDPHQQYCPHLSRRD